MTYVYIMHIHVFHTYEYIIQIYAILTINLSI